MTITDEEKTRRREMRDMIRGLSEAMEEAGRIIASPEAVDRCVNHVRLGVFIRYDVTVTVDVEGQYNVTVSSATHGTKGIIAKMKGLEP